MQKIWDALDGKKRIIGTVVIFIAGGLRAIDVIDEETFKTAIELGGAILAFGLGAALQKRQK